MSDRSGVGLVEVAILESLEALRASAGAPHVKCSRVVAAAEERIGLAPGGL